MSNHPKKTPGTYAKGDAKKAEILQTALTLIAENGYRRSTLSDIASRVGLTNAGVLHHFGSREKLFTAVIKHRDEINLAASNEEQLTLEILLDTMAHNQSIPGLSQLYGNLLGEAADPSHPAHEFFKDRFFTLSSALADDIGQQKPQWTSEVCTAIARSIIAAADGLQAQWLVDDSVDVSATLNTLLGELGLSIASSGTRTNN